MLGGTSLFGGFADHRRHGGGRPVHQLHPQWPEPAGVNPFWVQVVTGVILLLAVLLNTVVNRRVTEWARLAGAEPEPAAKGSTRSEPALRRDAPDQQDLRRRPRAPARRPEVAPGEMLGLVGDNAAGKSTLMKVLTGVYSPTRARS